MRTAPISTNAIDNLTRIFKLITVDWTQEDWDWALDQGCDPIHIKVYQGLIKCYRERGD